MERLILHRLSSHKLLRSDLNDPADVIRWLGAVQAQDFGPAKWAVGQRAVGVSGHDVERAFNRGEILRTHVLRPTWHFVTPDDIGWMLTLTAPRVQQFNAHYYRKLELDARTFSRARTIVARALEGGERTRSELALALKRGGIVASGPRLGLLTIELELTQLMCSGPLRGRQFTYALFERRVPQTGTLTREEALAELTRRFFRSHGPATLKDFAWWSGLTMRDVKTAVELLKPDLASDVLGGVRYWSVPSDVALPRHSSSAHLLPTYDEYLVAYKDRDLVVRTPRSRILNALTHHVIVNGLLVGSWKAKSTTKETVLDVRYHAKTAAAFTRALENAAERYGRFVGTPVRLA